MSDERNLLREEYLAAVRAAVAIRHEYHETGVVIEAEHIGSQETSFLLMPPDLADPRCSLLTLTFQQLQQLDTLPDQEFHDTVREWTARQAKERCDCPKCRAGRGGKPVEIAQFSNTVQFSNLDLSRLFNQWRPDL